MFGIDIIDASLIPAMLVALIAGVLSFLSPCVLPIVPPYLAYMSGISMGEMKSGRSPLLAALFFVLGLSTVFLLLGLAASAFGAFFLGNADTFQTDIDAGMVHHREHVADALVFFADQVANSAFVVAVGHDGGRTAVNAQRPD